jgi:hypothetical protein
LSNITGIRFVQQPVSFPGTGLQQTEDLKTAVLNTWTGLENGGKVNGQTVSQLVAGAIQSKVKASQNADSQLNSLTFGPQNQIEYSAAFVPPAANAWETGGGGRIDISLKVPGNNLAFTVLKSSNPTFEVAFELVVGIKLSFPVALSNKWAIGVSVAAVVEVSQVTTHNVGVYLCDKGAVNDVLKAINGQVIQVSNLDPPGLNILDEFLQAISASGWTQILEADDGQGNLLLTALGPNLFVNGGTNDKIAVATSSPGELQITVQNQAFTLKNPAFGPAFNVTVNTGGGTNEVTIAGLPSGGKASVSNGQHAKNTVTVGGTGGLPKLAGTTIAVADATGSTALIVDDGGDTAGRMAQITASSVVFTGLVPAVIPAEENLTVNYSGNIASLKVQGGRGGNHFFVSTTGAKTSTTIDGGPGANEVFAGVFGTNPSSVGTGDGTVAQIAGPLAVTDNLGQTSLSIDASDQGYIHYQVYSDHVSFTQGPTITYQPGFETKLKPDSPVLLTCGVTSLTVYGNHGGNDIQVNSVSSGTKVTLWGSSTDAISGPAAGSATHDVYAPTKVGPIPQVPHVVVSGV